MLDTLHRFTPPTCTLEIKGKKSPLSYWTKKAVLKNFQFKLSFDDPRLTNDKQIIVTGDRLALEQLKNSVDNYTQEILHSSLIPSIQDKNDDQFNHHQPYLRSQSLTNHELFFGNLNHDSAGNKMILSTVQLFDLVSALDAYSNQIDALPELQQAQRKKTIPIKTSIAAAIILMTGIGAIVLKSFSVQQIASSPQSSGSSTKVQLEDVIPPEAPSSSTKKGPQPKLNESISSTKRLPPPPAVDTPKPKPDIPDPADYPLSQVGRQSGFKKSPKEQSEVKPSAESITIIPTEQTNTPLATIKEDSASQAPSNNSTAEIAEESDQVAQNQQTQAKNIPSKPNQLQEIKAYFQAQWQPPADLKQSLEYRLYLNADGSIKRVIPIGKAATLYLSQTNIPVQGEKFISPLEQSQPSIIRLLLNPDGKVETLAE